MSVPRATAFLKKLVLLFLLVTVCSHSATCRGQGTAADYARMKLLPNLTSQKVFRTQVLPHWLPGNQHFWYRVQIAPNRHEFILVGLEKKERLPVFDHEKVASQLAALTDQQVAADAIPVSSLLFSEDLTTVYFKFADRIWKIARADSSVIEISADKLPRPDSSTQVTLGRSRDKGGEVYIEFINETDRSVRLFWINRNGGRQPYDRLAAGEKLNQHTYIGHRWLIVDDRNQPLMVHEANDLESVVRISGTKPIEIAAEAAPATRENRTTRRSTSPDGRYRAFAKNHQLWIKDLETDDEHQLTDDATPGNFFDRSFYWSPDSRHLVAIQIQPGEQRQIHMVESSPRDQLQPKLHTMTYVKPGDRIRTQRPRLFHVESKQEIPTQPNLFENPWRLTNFRWNADSSEFSFLFNQRGHQMMRIVGIDVNGKTRAIVEESTQTFIDYTNKVYSHYMEGQQEIIWMSERDGWNHLYLYDWQTGQVKNQITQGEWVVRSIERIDEKNRQVWFRASGIVPEQDPYYIHFCRIDFDGRNLVVLTAGDGTHSVQYSPNNQYLIDTYSRVDLPPVTEVRKVADGSLVCKLEKGDWSALTETGWKPTIPFSAKGRDGKTDIYGVIYRPTNFDPNKRYPVIEYIYAGPHNSFVPKSFSAHNSQRAMAELGFIVVQIDGMGTSNRSKAFHDVCWKNLGDSGFPDRKLWLQAAAEKYPQMDLERVGIYGGSAGGQSTLRGLLAHPDFYKVGVADCGCHDNRMDKIWWNEQWMGWPIGPHYDEQSNVTNAHRLQGKLFLIVGELDRNVDPASTMQVVNALIKADKDFDLLVVPGGGHGIGSGRYGMRRTRDFFVRHLLGVEPRR